MSSIDLPAIGPNERLAGLCVNEEGNPGYWLILIGPQIFDKDTFKNHQDKAMLHNAVIPLNSEFDICVASSPLLMQLLDDLDEKVELWVGEDHVLEGDHQCHCIYVRREPIELVDGSSIPPVGSAPIGLELPPVQLNAGERNVN